MARSVRRSVQSGRTQRRKLVWARQINTGAAIAVGAGETFNQDLMEPFRTQVDANLPGMTIIRVRGSALLIDTSGQSRMVIGGIRTYTRSPGDVAQSILDVDGPVEDEHADWMAYLTLHAGVATTLPVEFDVKSMRKLEEVSQSLAISFEAADALAAQVRFVVSVLVALP